MSDQEHMEFTVREVEVLASSLDLEHICTGQADADADQLTLLEDLARAAGTLQRYQHACQRLDPGEQRLVSLASIRGLKRAAVLLDAAHSRDLLLTADDLLGRMLLLVNDLQHRVLMDKESLDDGQAPRPEGSGAPSLVAGLARVLEAGTAGALRRSRVLDAADDILSMAWTMTMLGQGLDSSLLVQAVVLGRLAREASPPVLGDLETLAEHRSAQRLLHLDPVGTFLWSSLLEPSMRAALLGQTRQSDEREPWWLELSGTWRRRGWVHGQSPRKQISELMVTDGGTSERSVTVHLEGGNLAKLTVVTRDSVAVSLTLSADSGDQIPELAWIDDAGEHRVQVENFVGSVFEATLPMAVLEADLLALRVGDQIYLELVGLDA